MSIYAILGIAIVCVFTTIFIMGAIKVGAEADIRDRQMFEEWKKRNGIK